MKRKIGLFIFILFLLLLTHKGLLWLAVGVAIITCLCLLYYSKLKLFTWLRNNRFFNPVVIIIFIFLVSISARVFFIEIFAIPSGSMKNTLIEGDKVLVSKLNYGPSLPRSPFEIPWINLIWYLKAKASTNTDSMHWNYRRLKGYSNISHNDVVVFLYPFWKKKDNFIIKRCVGLAGDTLNIKNGTVFINGKPLSVPDLLKRDYLIREEKWLLLKKKSDSLDIKIDDVISDQTEVKISLTNLQYKRLFEDSLLVDAAVKDSTQWVYPKNKIFSWTINNYGPVVIPRKGMTITLTHQNYLIYQRTINRLEKQKIKEKDGLFFLDEEPVTTYTFHHNYYFMMGDHRNESIDSRVWGFVPDENIVGKAMIILLSNNEDGFCLRRIFSSIK